MAPVTSPPIDFRSQTIENCRFLSRPNVEFTIITTREPLGAIKAIALQAEGRKREAFLSGTGTTFLEALDDLHSKSADAAQNYISLNGLDFAPDLKKRDSDLSDGESVHSGSASSTLTVSDGDSSDDCESSSDNETVSIVWGHGNEKAKQKRGKAKKREARSKTTRARQSRSRSSSRPRGFSTSVRIDDDDDAPRRPFPPQMRAGPSPPRVIPGQMRGGWPPPPPPPPGWPGRVSGPPETLGTVRPLDVIRAPNQPPPPPHPSVVKPGLIGMRHPPPAPQQQQQHPTGAPGLSSQQQLHNVRLHIKWPGHGEQRVIDQTRPSLAAIRTAAVNYVRGNPHAFAGVTTFEAVPSRLCLLRATVRRAAVDGDDYDMTAYTGDDLRGLIEHASRSGIPRFEVELGMPSP